MSAQLKSDFLREIVARGFMHQCTDLAELDALAARNVVTAYIGFDATADSLHVGSLVQIMLLRLLQPLYALRLWRRGRAEPLYRHAIAERFGIYAGAASTGWVWVHAVSLGETRAVRSGVEDDDPKRRHDAGSMTRAGAGRRGSHDPGDSRQAGAQRLAALGRRHAG